VEAVIFVGLQGAGKTTFYKERFFATHLRLSLDMLKTRHRERRLLQACVETRTPHVVDNTNPTRAERQVYIQAAKEAGFQVVGYYFQSRSGSSPLVRLPAPDFLRRQESQGRFSAHGQGVGEATNC
jgi:predicted kinase